MEGCLPKFKGEMRGGKHASSKDGGKRVGWGPDNPWSRIPPPGGVLRDPKVGVQKFKNIFTDLENKPGGDSRNPGCHTKSSPQPTSVACASASSGMAARQARAAFTAFVSWSATALGMFQNAITASGRHGGHIQPLVISVIRSVQETVVEIGGRMAGKNGPESEWELEEWTGSNELGTGTTECTGTSPKTRLNPKPPHKKSM